MDLAGINQKTVCLYCQTYQKITPDYPVNPATFRMDSEVPRCQFHAQYQCDHCQKLRHFNGIAWCHDCQQFTCLRCGGMTITEQQFLVYEYYYMISCSSCNQEIASLDYAETQAEHPYQIGDLHPDRVLQVWLPFGQEINYEPSHKQWGKYRLEQMTVDVEFEPVDEVAGDSKIVWDENAATWSQLVPTDINHDKLIIPQMLRYLEQKPSKIMDIACGEGNFTRKLAELGHQVIGTDISNMIEYAMEYEKQEPLGIEYHKIGVHDLQTEFEPDQFDQITCNMALMDIDHLSLILDNIAFLLQPGGTFIFSITHPIFSWPVSKSIRLPRDSEHNEDKGWLVDNYLDEQPIKIHHDDFPQPMLYYPRKISTYLNELQNHGFDLQAMAEPEPDEQMLKAYPRDMYQDYDRNPLFMVFQAKLRTNKHVY